MYSNAVCEQMTASTVIEPCAIHFRLAEIRDGNLHVPTIRSERQVPSFLETRLRAFRTAPRVYGSSALGVLISRSRRIGASSQVSCQGVCLKERLKGACTIDSL